MSVVYGGMVDDDSDLLVYHTAQFPGGSVANAEVAGGDNEGAASIQKRSAGVVVFGDFERNWCSILVFLEDGFVA